jgi:lipid-A-disaccharide synthase
VSPTARPRRVILTVNGPGELAGWAYPLTVSLKRLAPDLRVGIALMPCVYSAGTEPAVAARLSTVDAVSPSGATLRWLFRGDVPPGFEGDEPTVVVHLGGEPLLTLRLAKRLACPAMAYLEAPIGRMGKFSRLFARDARVAARLSRASTVVGDLMVDAARLRCPHRRHPLPGDPPVIAILPGSRPAFYKHMLPFFLRVAHLANDRMPGARWIIARADFVSNAELARVAGDASRRAIEGDSAVYYSTAASPPDGVEQAWLISERGLRFDILETGPALAGACVALTMPGTSTAELSALGIPMVACTPSYKLDEVPLPGLLGYLDRLPLVGKLLKHGAVYVYGRCIRYLAHPNRRMRRRVVPEAIGRITASQVADMLVELASRKDDALARTLLDIMGPPGAADALAREILGLEADSPVA